MVNWCGPIEVGPLYNWGLIRCLAFCIYLSYLKIISKFQNCMFVQSKPEFYCLQYCSGTLTCIDCTVFPQTVVVSQFYIQPRAGFYL